MAAAVATWYGHFLRVIRQADLADPLREAAITGRRGEWTRALTRAVVVTCAEMGWRAVAKGHPADFMPAIRRRVQQEYLALDVVAFAEASVAQPDAGFRWPFPMAAIELENQDKPERMAFSLWKVIMARAQLRGVFVYCREREDIPALVRTLGQAVLPELPDDAIDDVASSLIVVVGTRSKVEAFPYGFFHEWVLSPQTRIFQRLH